MFLLIFLSLFHSLMLNSAEFCGPPDLKGATRLINSVSAGNPSIRDFIAIIAARLNIMRGIRVAVKLVPEDYAAKDILLDGTHTESYPIPATRAQAEQFRYDHL